MFRSHEIKHADFKFPSRHNALPPRARVALGLLCVAAGLLPVLAAFDIGPLGRAAIHGPAWLGAAAGSVFIVAGFALMLGEDGSRSDHPLSYVLLACVLGALAAVANWIAFGPGPRECSIAFDALETAIPANSLVCRTGFAIGAGVLDGFLIWLAAGAAQRFGASSTVATVLERLGILVLGIALFPIALPLALILFGRGLLGAFVAYCKTGTWPRNEALLARLKAKRDQRS